MEKQQIIAWEQIIKGRRFPYWENSSLALINFKTQDCKFFGNYLKFFDISSLTKPMVMSFFSLMDCAENSFPLELLEHRGGIPSWGLLSKKTWKEDLRALDIVSSSCVYSDLSILKLGIFFEDKFGIPLKELTRKYWSCCADFWMERSDGIIESVQDLNAQNLRTFLPHAGLFSSAQKFATGLISLNNKYSFIEKMKEKIFTRNGLTRFVYGWDTVGFNNPNSLAGINAPWYVFGHLGFSGCSVWIDPKECRGYLFFTDAKKYYWYDPYLLNKKRREIGALYFGGRNLE